jgi:predicted phage terminase large subunit-like protein
MTADVLDRTERLATLREKIDRLHIVEARERYEESFSEFLRGAWHAIDTAPFQSCFAIDGWCEHLEAVTLGYIPRLLGNFPPRCSKTLSTSVAWPAWIWARQTKTFLSGSQVQFLAGSYDNRLSLGNSNMTRRLILSPWYQKHWGDRFALRIDQNSKTRFDNTKGGSRISTSVRGSLLGLGGDVICFPADEIVHTEDGHRPIGEIVDGKLPLRVWSFDPKTGERALKPITGRHRNPGSAIVRVSLSDGTSFRCTPDHKIWTRRGWVRAVNLKSWDMLPRSALYDITDGGFVDSVSRGEPPLAHAGRADSAHILLSELRLAMPTTMLSVRRPEKPGCYVCPRVSAADVIDSSDLNPVSHSKSLGTCSGITNDLPDLSFGEDCSRSILMQGKCAVSFGILDVLRSCPIFEVAKEWISAIAILMAHFLSFGAWPNKGFHDHLVTESINRLSIDAHCDPRISLIKDWCEDALFDDVKAVGPRAFKALDTSEIGNGVGKRGFGDRSPIFVEFVGHVDKTYCLTVADYNTFVVGSGEVTVSNCLDDPHNTETEKKVESDADRMMVASWWKEMSSTRLNDPKRTALVVVMQRLHQQDLSGIILDGDEDFVHYCIPMEFEERRRCVTVVLPQFDEEEPWEDPRTTEGELMWPERFGRTEIRRMKSNMGPFMTAGRLQQNPIPKGGGIIKRDYWQIWDQVEAQRYGLEWNETRKEFPPFDLVVASVDTAYGDKAENDYNALTIWGTFKDMANNTRVMLMFAWIKRVPLHGTIVTAKAGEAKVNFQQRQQEQWGLVEWIADACKRYRVHRLIIEDKTRGRDVAEEIQRLYSREKWGVEMIRPDGDKTSRTHAVVSMFADGMIYAPETKWSELVLTNCERFPKDEHDDLHDTVTQFLNWGRDRGILIRADESSAALEDEMTLRQPQDTVAQQYGV